MQELRIVADDVADLMAWGLATSQQLSDLDAMVRRLQRENAHNHKILIRIMLDSFRNKFLQHMGRAMSGEEKLNWNSTVDNMSDADLEYMCVTRKQAALSKYGAQDKGSSRAATHDAVDAVDAIAVAYAVTAHSEAGFRAIYRTVYSKDADEAIEEAEAEAE